MFTVFKNASSIYFLIYNPYEFFLQMCKVEYKKREIDLELSSYECYEIIHKCSKYNGNCYVYSFVREIEHIIEYHTFNFTEKKTNNFLRDLLASYLNNELIFKDFKINIFFLLLVSNLYLLLYILPYKITSFFKIFMIIFLCMVTSSQYDYAFFYNKDRAPKFIGCLLLLSSLIYP